MCPMPTGWHSRGYLPHLNAGEVLQTVTFREVGTLPAPLVEYWRARLAQHPTEEEKSAYLAEVEGYLDRADGPSHLRQRAIASLVQSTLLHFDDVRYRLLAWSIMPNHVHALLLPLAPHDLSTVVQSWKGWSGYQANKLLDRQGAFWAPDYFDRYIRDDEHLAQALDYIEMNPVKVSLCSTPEEWPFGSASCRNGPRTF